MTESEAKWSFFSHPAVTVPLLTLLLLPILGLAALDYTVGIVFLAVTLIPVALVLVGPHLAAHMRHWRALEWLVFVLCIFLFTMTAAVAIVFPRSLTTILSGLQTRGPGGGGGGGIPIVVKYTADLTPVSKGSATTHFSLAEDIMVKVVSPTSGKTQTKPYRLPPRIVTGSGNGLLEEQLVIAPLGVAPSFAGATPQLNVILPDGSPLFGPLCPATCPPATVVIHDLPQGSFVQAKDASVTTSPYGNTETVQWDVANLEDGITFSYIQSPWEFLHKPLDPFLGITSAGQFVVTLFGLFYVVIFAAVTAVARKRLIALFWAMVHRVHPVPSIATGVSAVQDTARSSTPILPPSTGTESRLILDLEQHTLVLVTASHGEITLPFGPTETTGLATALPAKDPPEAEPEG